MLNINTLQTMMTHSYKTTVTNIFKNLVHINPFSQHLVHIIMLNKWTIQRAHKLLKNNIHITTGT